MTKKQRKEYGEFIEVLARNVNPNVRLYELAAQLTDLAKKAARYNLLACNVGLTDRQQKKADKVDEEAIRLGEIAGITILTNGDPRGYALKILCKDGSFNTWGGKENGWGIPEI